MNEIKKVYWPSVNLIGPGSLKEIGEELKGLKAKKVFIVTDKVLNKIGIVESLTNILKVNGIRYSVYDEVEENPTMENCHKGLKNLISENCDVIVSLGGGSPQDCAKAIGILRTNGGNIRDYEGIGMSTYKSFPIIAVNTTAGTASEVTINYVITDEERHIKMVMVDPNCLATISVNDPELMINKPKDLTAATGMDALTHAIEAYITAGSFRLSDTLALESIKLIGESLEEVVKDGTNITARSKMAWASYIAGLSFSNAGLGLVHSMAHQLGAEYNLPHGVANAMLLPYVEEFNLDVCEEKFGNIALALGADIEGLTSEEKASKAIEKIKEISININIPVGLKEVGVKEADLEKLSEQALADVCTGGNPKVVSKKDIMSIYRNAM